MQKQMSYPDYGRFSIRPAGGTEIALGCMSNLHGATQMMFPPADDLKILIADDDPDSRGATEALAVQWGYAVTSVCDGKAAWRILQAADAPKLAVLDWNMPGMDGVEVCRHAKEQLPESPPYLILLTGLTTESDLVKGLAGGADDYLKKPVSAPELQARLHAGSRVARLQERLSERVRHCEEALTRVKQLHGLLPICSYCKKIRDDHNYWRQVEEYIAAHSDTRFSHGICPDCFHLIVEPQLEELDRAHGPTDRLVSHTHPSTVAVKAKSGRQEKARPVTNAESQRRRESRREPRYLCNCQAAFRTESNWGTAIVRDVSVSGLRLELPCEVKPGNYLTVELVQPGSNSLKQKELRIVHAAKASDDRWVAGSAFVDEIRADEIQRMLNE